jgi:TolA-binding protein
MMPSGNHQTAIPSRGWPSFYSGAIVSAVAAMSLFLGGCSQMTLLRTHELRQVESRVDSTRAAVADVQKSLDALNIQQGGSTNRMRADLTAMLTDLQTQIARLHEEIDETQHRLVELNQKLDKLDKRKVVVTPVDTTQGASAGVKVVPGLDLQKIFAQAREDFIGGRYELAFQGFKSIYEKDDAGALREQSLYWMAECLLRADKQDKALETYQRVQTEFPKGTQRCAALLKAGLIYDQKQDISRRNEALNQLIAACPQSNEASRAKEILKP